MNKEIQEKISEIVTKVNHGEFLAVAEKKIEELEEIDTAGESIESLLHLLESNPQVDFGLPGPIVHFLEKFYKNGYEAQLILSVRRRPVPHNVWMLNRLINGSQGELKLNYIDELDSILRRSDVSQETKDAAAEFRRSLGAGVV